MVEMDSKGSVLFVDDEPRVLEGIENLLFEAPDDWEVSFASSAESALTRLEEGNFDVLVSDMRMPGMNGAQLLAKACERAPAVLRIVLSGHTEQEAANKAMDVAHEFLSKPCARDELFATLDRALHLAARFPREVREIFGTIRGLPVRPSVYNRLRQLVDDEASMSEIAELIAQDVSLATRVLHVANTAFYSRGRSVSSIHEGISLLGLATTCNLVLAAEGLEAFGAPRGLDMEQLHADALAVGDLAARIAPREHQHEGMLAGLLHDMGRLLLATHFRRAIRSADKDARRGVPIAEAERERLGVDHTTAGAYMLRLWSLSESVVEAVERHHLVGVAERSPVELAVFAASHAIDESPDDGLSEVELAAVARARTIRSES